MIETIISGGQVGADIAALRTARGCGIQTGGWMPRGFLTVEGVKPEYRDLYGMLCTDTPQYPPRTSLNVQHSDGTIRFATNWASNGERRTLIEIRRFKKPYLDIDPSKVSHAFLEAEVKNAVDWVQMYDICTLNVAGNAKVEIEEFVETFIRMLIGEVNS